MKLDGRSWWWVFKASSRHFVRIDFSIGRENVNVYRDPFSHHQGVCSKQGCKKYVFRLEIIFSIKLFNRHPVPHPEKQFFFANKAIKPCVNFPWLKSLKVSAEWLIRSLFNNFCFVKHEEAQNLVSPHFKNSSNINHGIFLAPDLILVIQSNLCWRPFSLAASTEIAIKVLDFMLRLSLPARLRSIDRKENIFVQESHHVMNETRDFSATSERTRREFPTFSSKLF